MTTGKKILTSLLEYGKLAPNFELVGTDGNTYTREIAVKDFPGEFAKPPSR